MAGSVALSEQIRSVRALIIRNQTLITDELIRGAKELIVLGRAGVGLDNVDLDACERAGVVVTSTPEQSTISVAELAIGLMLSLARKISSANADTKEGKWDRQRFFGTELHGKTFGIIGAGRIGLATARRAQAFGMKILATDPFVSRDNVFLAELNAEIVPFEDLLARGRHLLSSARDTRHRAAHQRWCIRSHEAHCLFYQYFTGRSCRRGSPYRGA